MNPMVILSGNMDSNLRYTVERACANEGVRCASWNSSQIVSPFEQQAIVLVGELISGSRNLPESVSALATRQYTQASILLFCNEPLAQKSKSVRQGRVTLVGPPPDIETVTQALQTAFDQSRNHAMTKSGVMNGIRQMRGRRWWAGCLLQPDASLTESKQAVAPYMDGQPEKGLGFWLPDSATSIDGAQIVTGLDLLGSDGSESRFGKTGKIPLAAMTLNLADNTWRMYRSNNDVSCWLLSNKRFPHAWHVSANSAPNTAQRIVAAGGDVFALWHDPHCVLKSAGNDALHLDQELLHAAECGGHALMDMLNTQASKVAKAFCALVVEVR